MHVYVEMSYAFEDDLVLFARTHSVGSGSLKGRIGAVAIWGRAIPPAEGARILG